MRWLGALCVAFALSSCSAGEDKSAAELGVKSFHHQYDTQRFDEIYGAATPAFRDSASKEKFHEFMSAVHRKLGTVQTSEEQGWHVNYGPGGGQVTLAYKTTFANGAGTETFIYQGSGSTPRLAGYNINSDALVMN